MNVGEWMCHCYQGRCNIGIRHAFNHRSKFNDIKFYPYKPVYTCLIWSPYVRASMYMYNVGSIFDTLALEL